jgi:type III secretion system YscX-like protein
MAEKILPRDYTNFAKGIETISIAKDLQKSQLPDLARLVPSEQEETQLKKLWKPSSLESLLKESLLPIIRNRDDLTPVMYQKRLLEAKSSFKKLLEEENRKRKKKAPQPFEEDPAEIFAQVISDLEELESHQDLLWMLRQVVHLA